MITKYVLILTLGGFTKGWQMGYGYSAVDITYHPTKEVCEKIAYHTKMQIRNTNEDMKKITIKHQCLAVDVPAEE